MKEMTGSGIFNGDSDTEESGSADPVATNRTGIRMYQVLIHLLKMKNSRKCTFLYAILTCLIDWICQQAIAGISHISFGEEESVSPKKPATLPEVAKQRELSGTLDSDESQLQKQLSDAKCKELSGHNIFAPPPEIVPRPITARTLDLKGSIEIGESASSDIGTSVKVSDVSYITWTHTQVSQSLLSLTLHIGAYMHVSVSVCVHACMCVNMCSI